MSNFNSNEGYELGWDAVIENEGSEFIVAEPGDYDFTVIGFERARHEGSAKIPPCNKAIVSIQLEIPGESGNCVIKHNLLLHSKVEWKLCEFFTAIGQRKKGERVQMNWNAVNGARGRCKVTKRSYISKTSGKELWTNDIEKFYEPEQENGLPFRTDNLPQSQPVQQGYQQTAWQGGKF